jgi:hypothetical protein
MSHKTRIQQNSPKLWPHGGPRRGPLVNREPPSVLGEPRDTR